MAASSTISRRTRSSWLCRSVLGLPMALPSHSFQTGVVGGVASQRTHYVPSSDGQRCLITIPSAEQAVAAITVVLNATAGFEKQQ